MEGFIICYHNLEGNCAWKCSLNLSLCWIYFYLWTRKLFETFETRKITRFIFSAFEYPSTLTLVFLHSVNLNEKLHTLKSYCKSLQVCTLIKYKMNEWLFQNNVATPFFAVQSFRILHPFLNQGLLSSCRVLWVDLLVYADPLFCNIF